MTGIRTCAVLVGLLAGAGLGCRANPTTPPTNEDGHEAAAGAAQQKDQTPAVKVETSVDRTAVWVGDPIVWTVEIICPPTFDVVEEDLAAEKITAQGLEIVSAETDRTTSDDGTSVYRVRYHLKSFDIGSAVLRTQPAAPLRVRYYERRPSQRVEDLTPAGEVMVPGAVVAWRSTLPGTVDSVTVRPDRRPDAIPAILSVARPLGLTLVLISAVPVALWAFSRVREVRMPRQRRPSARAARSHTMGVLTQLRDADTSTPAALHEAYAQLNDAVRQHIALTTNLPAAALAASEFERRTAGTRLDGAALGELLGECARARYGRPEDLPSPDRFRASVEAAERLL